MILLVSNAVPRPSSKPSSGLIDLVTALKIQNDGPITKSWISVVIRTLFADSDLKVDQRLEQTATVPKHR